MTGQEIVQALRCCTNDCERDECPALKIHGAAACMEMMCEDAVHLIERLTAENAALREKQRWILVTERLPEKQQRVIVRCKTVGTTVGWIMFGEWVTDLGPECGEVTHWMPLPGAPEG